MGLDMYLYRETRKADKRCKLGYRVVKGEEVCYWRKANQIRGWLIRHNVIEDDDNCVSREVDRDTIGELIADCEGVLNLYDCTKLASAKTGNDPLKDKIFLEMANEVLPPTSGFFFGGEGFDEFYIEDLRETADKLTTVLETTTDNDTLVYSDWW